MRLKRLLLLSSLILLVSPQSRADAPAIEFGPRDDARCGDADRVAEQVLVDVLGHPHVRADLAEASIFASGLIEYLPEESQECRDFRRTTLQRQSEHGFRRAQHGNPSAWVELWVHEYFELDGGIAHVVLQSSTTFQEQLDYDNPLTTAWPGRYDSVAFFDVEGRRVAVFNSLGRSLDTDE